MCQYFCTMSFRIKIGNDEIERKSTVKFLGMHIDSILEWHEHIEFIQNKLSSGLYAMNKVKHMLSITVIY